jgi:hypothetical protein
MGLEVEKDGKRARKLREQQRIKANQDRNDIEREKASGAIK